jgi:hypothetical protein
MMEIIQNTHLHPFVEERKAPVTGPIIGPNKVPSVNMDIAKPRSSCRIISAMMPPPFVKGQDAKVPCNSLITINMLRLVDKAHAMEKIKNPMHPTCCTVLRP